MLDIIINNNENNKIDDGNILHKIGYYFEKINTDYTRAKYYYELAIKQDSSDAMVNLGLLYRRGHSVEKDYIKAKYYYELAIEQNNDQAMCNLGILYHYGFGIEKDYSKAKYYYELAIEQNNDRAMNNLGSLYHHGYGVEQDYTKAKYYYELAIKQNNGLAMNNLGILYSNGHGVVQDRLKAIYLYNSATQNNYYDANRNLSKLLGFIDIDKLKPNLYYKLSSRLFKRILLNRLSRNNEKIPYDPRYISIFADGIKRGLFNKNWFDEEKLLESYEKYQLSTYKKIKNKFGKHVPLRIASLITDFL
jgi:TPR repeat protein